MPSLIILICCFYTQQQQQQQQDFKVIKTIIATQYFLETLKYFDFNIWAEVKEFIKI